MHASWQVIRTTNTPPLYRQQTGYNKMDYKNIWELLYHGHTSTPTYYPAFNFVNQLELHEKLRWWGAAHAWAEASSINTIRHPCTPINIIKPTNLALLMRESDARSSVIVTGISRTACRHHHKPLLSLEKGEVDRLLLNIGMPHKTPHVYTRRTCFETTYTETLSVSKTLTPFAATAPCSTSTKGRWWALLRKNQLRQGNVHYGACWVRFESATRRALCIAWYRGNHDVWNYQIRGSSNESNMRRCSCKYLLQFVLDINCDGEHCRVIWTNTWTSHILCVERDKDTVQRASLKDWLALGPCLNSYPALIRRKITSLRWDFESAASALILPARDMAHICAG